MRPDVRRYATSRVKDLEGKLLADLRKKFSTPGSEATPQALFAHLKAGTLPFKKNLCMTGGTNEYARLGDIYDMKAFDVVSKFDEKAYNKAAKPILKKVRQAMDFIMLGQDEPALKCIQEFEASYGED